MFELFQVAQAIRIIFHYRFEISDENLIELTFYQYQSLKRQGYDVKEKIYRITRGMFEERNNLQTELPIIYESDVQNLKKAIELIYKMSDDSGGKFINFGERLDYLKKVLPPIMTKPPKSMITSVDDGCC